MFQFRRFPSYTYLIQCTILEYCSSGLPHSEIPGSMDICSSPRLIAACHVLRRLLMPRHSPCALISLTNHFTRYLVLWSWIMQASQIVLWNCNRYPSIRCSTIKITSFCTISGTDLSVALLITFIIHCSVFKVQSLNIDIFFHTILCVFQMSLRA